MFFTTFKYRQYELFKCASINKMGTNIYVLRLENDKYYVGKSKNINDRILNHFEQNGSEWTKLHKPIQVIELIEDCDDFDEDKYVKIYMAKYGIQNVRGGSYSKINLSETAISFLSKELRGCSDRCFECGSENHFISDCPNIVQKDTLKVKSKNNKLKGKCTRCDRLGHNRKQCFAKTKLNGTSIKIKKCGRCRRKGHNRRKCFAKKDLNGKLI